MGFWNALIGGGVKEAGEGVKTALDGAGGFLKDLRTAVTGRDPELDAKVLAAMAKVDEAQNALNLAQAASSSLFIAGWRPAVGWVCALSLALFYPLRILVGMTIWAKLAWSSPTVLPLPDMGIADITGLILSLLGMSGLRTYEKKSEVAR